MKIYTRKGDDGSTGLLWGGRVSKASERPTAYGSVDEAQAALGVARAGCGDNDELNTILVALERDLWVLMAELATAPGNRHKLTAGKNLVTSEMVDALEVIIDDVTDRFVPPAEFVVPGEDLVAAQLDVARCVVRRAERDALVVDDASTTQVVPYLNRLSDLCWTLARWRESSMAGGSLTSRTT